MRTSELCRGLWRKNTGCEDRVYGVGNGVIDRGPPKASRERDSKVGGEGCSWGPGCEWNRAGGRGRRSGQGSEGADEAWGTETGAASSLQPWEATQGFSTGMDGQDLRGFFKIYLYVLAIVGLHCCTLAFSSCREWGLLFSCGTQASHCSGFSCCGGQTLGMLASVVVAYGLVALQHVGYSQTRDGTCVPCIGRQILYHWTTSKVPRSALYKGPFGSQEESAWVEWWRLL